MGLLGTVILGPLEGLLENCTKNAYKNICCDIFKPQIGSVLKVDLILSPVSKDGCHTGIYIGNNEIVELTQNEDGKAEIRIVSAEQFVEGDNPFPRTGCFIYVACGKSKDGAYHVLGKKQIANRAKNAVGMIWRGEYDLTQNNCHMFSQYCITGQKTGNSPLLDGIESALQDVFDISNVDWYSTGESRGSNPFFSDDLTIGNYESKFNDLLEKAKKGDPESQFKVGQAFVYGKGVDLDDEEAVKWYLRAAQNGYVEAMYEMAKRFEIGLDVVEDDEKAIAWYRKAARKGHAESMYQLGIRYFLGEGVSESNATAKKWYKKAADAGHRKAKKDFKKYFY